MVARLLRLEALEGRRLMAIDLDALPLTPDTSSDSPIAFANQPTNGVDNEEIAYATSDQVAPVDPLYSRTGVLSTATLVQQPSTSNPFIVETGNYLVALQPNFGQHRSRLNLVQRSSDGGAEFSGYIEVDFQVERLVRFGEQVVIFGSRFDYSPANDRLFLPPTESMVAVLDPALQEIVYRKALPGGVSNIVELPDGIVLQTGPMIYALADTVNAEQPSVSTLDSSVTPPPFSSAYRLGFLHRTETSFDVSWQESTPATTLATDGASLVTVTQQFLQSSEAGTFHYALQRWVVVGNALESTASLTVTSPMVYWEYISSFQISPTGSHLLMVRSSQNLLDNDTWAQRSTFDWFSLAGETLTQTGSFTSEGDPGTVQWIDNQSVALLSYSPTDTVRILHLGSRDGSQETKIQLAQPLQLNQVIRIDESHIAVTGFTPATPLPVAAPGEPLPEIVPMWQVTEPRGAMVIIDTNIFQVTDEQVLAPRTFYDQPFLIDDLQGFVAWRSLTTEADWSLTERIILAKLNEQGRLELTEEFTLGSDWSFLDSNGTSLYTLRNESIESRSWTDLSQLQWRISLPREVIAISEPIPSLPEVPREQLRGDLPPGMGEVTTTVSPSPLDTNGDGLINPIDILQVINYINQAYARGESDDLVNLSDPALARFDFDGDSKILPTDALMMIASLNIVHATFDAQEKVENQESNTPETCFWDMVNSETELPIRAAEEAIDDFFNNEVDVEEFGGDEQWWDWFAPWDPMAEKMKIRLIGMSFPSLDYSLVF